MAVNNSVSKGKINFLNQLSEDSCCSTSIFSFQSLDEIIQNNYRRFHPQISHSSSDLSRPPEERELDKLNKLIARIRTKQQINQIKEIMASTQFPSIKNKVRELFLGLFLRPSERASQSDLLSADDIIQQFHRFFQFFDEEDQVELLDALTSMLLQVSPNPAAFNNEKYGIMPSFNTYASTIKACTLVLKKCIKINFSKEILISYVKAVLQNSLKIATNLAEISMNLSSKPKLTSNAIYIGEFLPFIAEIEPLMTNTSVNTTATTTASRTTTDKNDSDDINRLIQQFLITAVLFTIGSPNVLGQWSDALDQISRFMPPLIQRKPKIDFSSTKVRIQELLSLYRPQTFQKIEDVVPLFAKYLPAVPAKHPQQLDLADGVYAISIFYLESMRAERGIFGPILEYVEVEYNPSFTPILDGMIDQVLMTFYRYLNDVVDLERKAMCTAFTMIELIKRYSSPNVRVQTRVDPILKKFAMMNPIVICNVEVLQAIGDTLSALSTVSPQRQASFLQMLNTLFSVATTFSPNSFFSALYHSQVSTPTIAAVSFNPSSTTYANITNSNNNNINSNLYSSNTSTISIMPFVEMLPVDIRDQFMREFIMKCVTSGQAQFATPETIATIAKEEDRLLLTASYVILHPLSDALLTLEAPASPHSLVLSWAHIAMKSISLSKLIIQELITSFVDYSEQNAGIFASTLDSKVISYQTTLLHFFVENATLGRHYAEYSTLLSCGMSRKFISHSSTLPSVLAYAYLGCLVMKSSFDLSAHFRDDLHRFILRLVLIAYSFTYDDYVLKYVSPLELFYLEQLISLLPDTIMSSFDSASVSSNSSSAVDSTDLSSNTANNKSYNSQNESILTAALGGKSRGTVSRSITSAANHAEVNFLNSMKTTKSLKGFVSVVAYLLCDQLQIFSAFVKQNQTSPQLQRLMTLRQVKPNHMHLGQTVRLIWKLAPEALYPFCKMTRIGADVISTVVSNVESDMFTAPNVPMLATIYALTPKVNVAPLAIWRAVPGNKALALLTANLMKNRTSASYIAKCFNLFSRRESLLFLPQLVQSLRFDSCGILRQFLIDYCKQSEVFCHYLLWNILAEKNNPIGQNDNLPKILTELEVSIIDNMNRAEKKNYENEFGLIDKLDEVSQKLLPMDIDKRPSALVDMLNEMELPEGLYIPSNPNYKIISIDADHSVPLKSHARVPILVHFKVYDEDNENKNVNNNGNNNENNNEAEQQQHKPIPFSCIFKIHDDVRQDAMMIQFIDMTKQILTDAGIDHFLFPYRVFATGTNRGVIECIPNAKSRHDLGVATNEELLPYFVNKYGQVGTPEFQQAQYNFIKSVVPYSLICYLFQVKDRHNANIMIDEEGHVIHIDFGFIFEISPGGNMKFERSPFKLTKEMINVMGGSKEAPAFQKFVKLLTQCFFAVRARHEELEAITYLMMNAGFPCFLPDSIKKLQARLFLDKSAKETCTEVMKLIDGAYEANSTTMYDAFQKAQNDIYF